MHIVFSSKDPSQKYQSISFGSALMLKTNDSFQPRCSSFICHVYFYFVFAEPALEVTYQAIFSFDSIVIASF